jgi:hypothetical protein
VPDAVVPDAVVTVRRCATGPLDGESIALAVLWELARAGKILRPARPGDHQVRAGPPGQRGAQLNPGKTFAESALGRADSADVSLQIRSG